MDRLGDWKKFSSQMETHIREYAIPQYQSENRNEDQVNASTLEECVTAIKKYISRFGKNIRGNEEALRDMLKIAHYAQFAYDKLKIELNEEDIYGQPDRPLHTT